MFSAILFDLDNTLIDRDAAVHSLLHQQFPDSPSLVEELMAVDNHGQGDRSAFVKLWRQTGGPDWTPAEFASAVATRLQPDPDLLAALQQLSSVCITGIITNGGSRSQKAKWKAAGLDTVIPEERLWISEELGVCKPATEIFHTACAALKVNPEDCLYCGDQPETDITGAKRAGLEALLVERPLQAADVRQILGDYHRLR